jgi:hypothetical protein
MGIEKRGFGSMGKTRLKELCSKGGTTSQKSGHGHRWDSAAGTTAGLKGNQTRAARKSPPGTTELQKATDTPDE